MSKFKYQFVFCRVLIVILFTASSLSAQISSPEPTEQQLLSGKPIIYKLKPERKDGRGYKLVYLVDAPLDVYWKFKIDFDNDFLLSNKFIKSHRLVSRRGNIVITENEYSNNPNAIFRWQTTVLPDRHLLKFILLNPEECGQKYHYGRIQVEAWGQKTKVTQIAYFNFFGVSLWVGYPFYGGMSYFLNNNAVWEQQIVLKLKEKYSGE
jgi:hypothetical protein